MKRVFKSQKSELEVEPRNAQLSPIFGFLYYDLFGCWCFGFVFKIVGI